MSSNGHSQNLRHLPTRVSGPQIIVVDDEPRDLVAFERVLTRHGFRVLTATTAERGCELLDSYAASAIVADYHLRGSEDGMTVLEYAAQAHPSVPRFIWTADGIGAALAAENPGTVWIDKDEPVRALVDALREATGHG